MMQNSNSDGPPEDATEEPVVVTYREVEKVLTGQEARGNIAEAANKDSEATPIERASVMAAMGNVLNELRRAEEKAGALVLTTPHHGPASRLQSLIASARPPISSSRRCRPADWRRSSIPGLVRLGNGRVGEAQAPQASRHDASEEGAGRTVPAAGPRRRAGGLGDRALRRAG